MKLTAQQSAFAETDENLCAFIGGRQSGKSTAIMHRAARLHSKHNENDSVLIVAPTPTMKRSLRKRVKNDIPQAASSDRISVIDCSKPYPMLIRGKDHVLFDEFQLSDTNTVDGILHKIMDMKTLSIALTPTKRNLSIPNSYEVFSAPTMSNPAVDPKNVKRMSQMGESPVGIDIKKFSGHHIIDKDGKINCVVCGESTTYDEESAADRLASYGLFQGCDCL